MCILCKVHGALDVFSVLTKHCLVCTACIQYNALLDGRRLRGRGRIPDGQDLVGKHSSPSRSMLLMLVHWARQKRLSKHVHLDGMTLTRLETGMDSSIPKIWEWEGREKNPFL